MDAPKKEKDIKEKLIFDKGPSVSEKNKKKKEYQENKLNE